MVVDMTLSLSSGRPTEGRCLTTCLVIKVSGFGVGNELRNIPGASAVPFG